MNPAPNDRLTMRDRLTVALHRNVSPEVSADVDRRTGGFTLTEMLVTLLILVLASTLMATGIPVAVDTYQKTVKSANAQVALSTTTTVLRSELGLASDVRVVGADAYSTVYYLSQEGYWASIGNCTDSAENGLIKTYWAGQPTEATGTEGLEVPAAGPITYPLVPKKAIAGAMREEDILNVKYDAVSMEQSGYVEFTNLHVEDDQGNKLASIDSYRVLTRFAN